VPPLPAESAAALAADIADLIIQKLQATEPPESPAPPVAAENVPPTPQLSAREATAATAPPLAPVVAAEELSTEAVLPAEEATPEQAELPALIADAPASLVQEEVSVMPASPALEITPAVSELPAGPPPPAFDLAAFAPIAPPQHFVFVVETEPSLLDDSDSLTAAISRAVDRAMRALRILPGQDQPAPASLSSAPTTPDIVAELVPESLAAAPQVPSAEETQPTLTDAAEPPIEAAPTSIPTLQPTAQVVPAAHPESDLSETAPDPATVAAIEADAAMFDLPPHEELLAPEANATAVEPVVPVVEESPQATLAPEAVLEAQMTIVVPAPAIVEPAFEVSSAAPIEEPSLQPVPEEAAALDSCPACAQATAVLSSPDSEVLAALPLLATPEPVIAIPAEPEITVVRCAVCDNPYSILENACPACTQAAEKVVMISAPAPIVDIPQTVATAEPETLIPGPAPEDTMTLIDALDFFEELTRKLRA
jgi:hypothetical protein